MGHSARPGGEVVGTRVRRTAGLLILGRSAGRVRATGLGFVVMVPVISALLGVSLAVTPLPASGQKDNKKTENPARDSKKREFGDGGEWGFTDGNRRRRDRQVAVLPSKSLDRTPIRPAGGYQGLRLESKAQPPIAVIPAPKGAPVLTWVGFQRDAGNQGVVFVQVDQSVEHEVKRRRHRIEIFLPGVKVTQKNHARTLDLRFFPQTYAKKVRTKVTSKGTRVTVAFRGKAKPEVRTRPGPEGQHQILVAFPPKP